MALEAKENNRRATL
jgi:hypothetical protein